MKIKEITDKNLTVLTLKSDHNIPVMDSINVNKLLKTQHETIIRDLRRTEQLYSSWNSQQKTLTVNLLNQSRISFHKESAALIRLLKEVCWEPDADLESRIKHVQLLQKNVQFRWNKVKKILKNT